MNIPARLNAIKKIVEEVFEIENISKNRRTREVAEARFVYFVLARKHTDYSYQKIGETMNRSHATALKAKDFLDKLCEIDFEYKRKAEWCEQLFLEWENKPTDYEDEILEKIRSGYVVKSDDVIAELVKGNNKEKMRIQTFESLVKKGKLKQVGVENSGIEVNIYST